MMPFQLLGVSEATFGVALAVAWLLVLVGAIYRYREDEWSRARAYGAGSAAGLWLGFSFLQISTGVSGTVELLVYGIAVGCFFAGLGAGARWWSSRSAA